MTLPKITLVMPEYRVSEDMSGIGVRALDLATAMSQRAKVKIICNSETDLPLQPFDIVSAQSVDLAEVVAECDAAIFFDLGDACVLREAVKADRFIVVENAVPLEHLEYNSDRPLEVRNRDYQDTIVGFRAQVAVADHFLARSEIERRLLVGALALEGRLSPADIDQSRSLRHLVSPVPIGVCERDLLRPPCRAIEPGLFLWTGGLWDFMDYEIAIDAFGSDEQIGRLELLYRPPQNQALRAGRLWQDPKDAPPAVRFLDRKIAHSQRGEVIQRANGLICIAKPGVENDTCVRLRIRDSLLYRRPIVVDLHGYTGEYVASTGIGLALRDPTPVTIAKAVVQLHPDGELFEACLDAIERERLATTLDHRLDNFFAVANAAGWRSAQSREARLARLDRIVPQDRALAPPPFSI